LGKSQVFEYEKGQSGVSMYRHNGGDHCHFEFRYLYYPSFQDYPTVQDEVTSYFIPTPIADYLSDRAQDHLNFSKDNYRPLNPRDYKPSEHVHCLIFQPISYKMKPEPGDPLYPLSLSGKPISPYHIRASYIYPEKNVNSDCPYAINALEKSIDPIRTYILRPTQAYAELLNQKKHQPNQFLYTAPYVPMKDVMASQNPEPVSPYNLTISYDRYVDNQPAKAVQVYYHVVDAKKNHYLGLIRMGERKTLKHLPEGSAQIYYGLTREDASPDGQNALQKSHQQLLKQLQSTLDSMIMQVSEQAAKQKAALQNKGLWGKGWAYTEAFAQGFKDGTVGLVESTIQLMTVPFSAMDALGNTLMACLQQGDISPLKANFAKLQSSVQATEKDFIKLARLLTDSTCCELLLNFPVRYYQADSGIDEVRMLGGLAPSLVLALLTDGFSLVADSAKAAEILEAVGGEEGTIERALVRTEDQGVVESEKSLKETVKGDKPILLAPEYKVPCFPAKSSRQFKKLKTAEEKEAYLNDYQYALQRQQDAMNRLSSDQWKQNKENYLDPDRKKLDDRARGKFRKKSFNRRVKFTKKSFAGSPYFTQEMTKQLYPRSRYPGMDDKSYSKFISNETDKRINNASFDATKELYQNLDATHELDGVVGGIHTDPEHTLQGLSMENRSINRSIGSHWAKGRAAALEKEVHSLPSQVRLNVRLSICP
jgi:hypothetical protein